MRRHHISHADLRRRLGLPSMMALIDALKLGWIGHLARMPMSRVPARLMRAVPSSPARQPGAAAPSPAADMEACLIRAGFPLEVVADGSWMATAASRPAWRKLVAATRRDVPRPAAEGWAHRDPDSTRFDRGPRPRRRAAPPERLRMESAARAATRDFRAGEPGHPADLAQVLR